MHNKNFRIILLSISILYAAIVACGAPASATPRKLNLYPTPTSNATQTPIIITATPKPTNTPLPTATERVVVVVATATIAEDQYRCVSAEVALNLRTQPSMTQGTNGIPLPNGARVLLTETKNGDWVFVKYESRSGWINGEYLAFCE